ncbi:DcaP family trimeric outer membrane transporter [Colwellia sp. E2M01]|uniref:DcaP family trimeric outer membrane transporter n=1 Tax=Colwellia sp. E2M01 TaxID=2841561 RepID=UPI001C09DFB3|nr:DcaP family trimeric outer membrane transporter [Colwellia sp. E2M01]MBU2871032.1 hypothetical protein [Colwellia sp. E2M01]
MTNHALNTIKNLNVAKPLSLTLVALSVFCSVNAYSQETDQQRIQSLEKRLQELEKQVQKQGSEHTQQTFIENEVILVDIPKTEQRASYEFAAPDKSIKLSNSDTVLQIGGQVWLDAIYNSGEMTNRAGFQPSSIAHEDNTTKDDTLLTVGQSKLSFKSFTPTDYGVMTTRFEFDMFDSSGDAGFHLTHLWGEIGDFGAGQTFSGFMDINSFPNTLEYWGPNSMIFVRQPQVRYNTAVSKHGRVIFTIEKSSSDFATPAVANSTDYNSNNDNTNELPDFTAAYLHSDDFGYIKSVMILRKLGYKTSTSKDTTLGWGMNISGLINLPSDDSIQYQFIYGEGIGRYVNDTCCNYYSDVAGGVDAGLNDNGNLKAIPVAGGFAYYNKQWNDKFSSAIGYSYLTVDNLNTQNDNSIKDSAYSTVNLLWSPDEQIKTGVELQYGDIQSKSGTESDNFRIQASVGFKY